MNTEATWFAIRHGKGKGFVENTATPNGIEDTNYEPTWTRDVSYSLKFSTRSLAELFKEEYFSRNYDVQVVHVLVSWSCS